MSHIVGEDKKIDIEQFTCSATQTWNRWMILLEIVWYLLQSLFALGKDLYRETLAVALLDLHALPENIGEVDDKASFLWVQLEEVDDKVLH